MQWRREGRADRLLQAGGVAVAAIGLVGAAVTGAFSAWNSDNAAEAGAEVAEIRAQVEERRIEEETRAALCRETFDFLEDETPNTGFSAEIAAARDRMIVQNLKACTISVSYDDARVVASNKDETK